MKTVAHIIFLVMLSLVATQNAHAADGEAQIQRFEHELNQTLSMSRSEQLATIEKISAQILELVAKNQVTAARAELALDFIDRLS